MAGMNGRRKDQGGIAAFLVAGCLVVVVGVVMFLAAVLAFERAMLPQRSRAAKLYLEQQAARARAAQAAKAQESDAALRAAEEVATTSDP